DRLRAGRVRAAHSRAGRGLRDHRHEERAREARESRRRAVVLVSGVDPRMRAAPRRAVVAQRAAQLRGDARAPGRNAADPAPALLPRRRPMDRARRTDRSRAIAVDRHRSSARARCLLPGDRGLDRGGDRDAAVHLGAARRMEPDGRAGDARSGAVDGALARAGLVARLRAAALLTAVLILPWSLAPRRFELWTLDVGAGTATVLRGPGIGTWIFDAGSRDRPDVAREALAPLLRDLDVGRLGIALSHTDRDH